VCSSDLVQCTDCDGKRFLFEEREDVVIPLEYRDQLSHRNRTYGWFGIYGYDLEDFCIEDITYDRMKKKLCLTVTS